MFPFLAGWLRWWSKVPWSDGLNTMIPEQRLCNPGRDPYEVMSVSCCSCVCAMLTWHKEEHNEICSEDFESRSRDFGGQMSDV